MRFTKQPNEEWLVHTLHGGGQMEIKSKDTAIYDTDQGLFIIHNDRAQTSTFVPVAAIAWIRTWWPNGGKVDESSLRGRALYPQSARPIEPPMHELEFGGDEEEGEEEVVDGEVVDDRWEPTERMIALEGGYEWHEDAPPDCQCAACVYVRETLAAREIRDQD